MMRGLTRGIIAAGFVAAASATTAMARPSAAPPKTETAVFAGGCFWGIQSVFQHMKGVISATSGYAGGTKDHPDYEDVSSGRDGSRRVGARGVRSVAGLVRRPDARSSSRVAHDPTQLNRQGPDVGTQYRSALFYMTDEQKDMAEAYIDQLKARTVLEADRHAGREAQGLLTAPRRTTRTTPSCIPTSRTS